MPSGGAVRIFLSSFLFVLTGLVQTVCIQAVLYSGGGDRSTFLLALPNYVGIICVNFFGARAFQLLDNFGVWSSNKNQANRVHLTVYQPHTSKHYSHLPFFKRLFHRDRRKLFILAFNELGGFLTGLTGLSIAGSGLYQVVFSGGTVFTALLSTFFLRKSLSIAQWLSVAIITFGLMITAEQVTHMRRSISSTSSTSGSSEADATSVISGLSFVLVSCLFYSTNYVIAEYMLGSSHDGSDTGAANANGGSGEDEEDVVPATLPPPSGLDLSLYTGGSCLLFFSIYVMVHTVPQWHELVTSSIQKHHGNTTIIAEYYLYLFIASFVHAITHYDVLATVGAVPIGVLNALRAVSVFAASSYLFCSNQASQCYNSRKGVSTAIVIGGALAYSAASVAGSRKERKHPSRVTSGGIVKTSREEITRYKFSRFGRRLKKAISSYMGFNQRPVNTPAHHSVASLVPPTSQNEGGPDVGEISKNDNLIRVEASSSNPEGWSSSIKTSSNPGSC